LEPKALKGEDPYCHAQQWPSKTSISSADERWLDHEANTVEEEHVIHDLEKASDYERGLERLDRDGKAIVKKLRGWAGDLMKVAGKKRKRTRFYVQLTI